MALACCEMSRLTAEGASHVPVSKRKAHAARPGAALQPGRRRHTRLRGGPVGGREPTDGGQVDRRGLAGRAYVRPEQQVAQVREADAARGRREGPRRQEPDAARALRGDGCARLHLRPDRRAPRRPASPTRTASPARSLVAGPSRACLASGERPGKLLHVDVRCTTGAVGGRLGAAISPPGGTRPRLVVPARCGGRLLAHRRRKQPIGTQQLGAQKARARCVRGLLNIRCVFCS